MVAEPITIGAKAALFLPKHECKAEKEKVQTDERKGRAALFLYQIIRCPAKSLLSTKRGDREESLCPRAAGQGQRDEALQSLQEAECI